MITIKKSQLNLHSITDPDRFSINSVHVEDTKEKTRAVAKNGKALAIVDYKKSAVDEADFKDVKITMPAELAKETANQLKKYDTAKVRLENGRVFVKTGVIESSADDNYNFPNYQGVIPTDTPKATIRLNPKLLIDLLKTATIALDGESVVLEILEDESKPMRITGENGNDSFLGLIVPMKK